MNLQDAIDDTCVRLAAKPVVIHDRFQNAHNELLFQLRHGTGFDLILFVGPTGIGKSTLVAKLFHQLMEQERDEMNRDLDYMPAVYSEARAAGQAFDWKLLYGSAAKAAGDPFWDTRRVAREARMASNSDRALFYERRNTSQLRLAMENEFQRRRTKYWFIDEAAHILSDVKSGPPSNGLNVLKSIAQSRNVKIILIGSYDLAQLIDAGSGQLARRTSTVHLARYSAKEPKDQTEFASSLIHFMKTYELKGSPDVQKNFRFFYSGSAGCIGTAKDWCDRAVDRARYDNGRRELTLKDFRETQLRELALKRIWTEILTGEELFEIAHDEELAALEALVVSERLISKAAPADSKGRAGQQKPGIRNPGRDRVGPANANGRGDRNA